MKQEYHLYKKSERFLNAVLKNLHTTMTDVNQSLVVVSKF